MSQTFNTDIEHDSAAIMAQNGETKANNGRKRVLVVGAGAAGYVIHYRHVCLY
jgi:NADPH-dependent 2,4-dienoyl-CoA reductase/sulfur reductase-like enzyme